MLHGLAPTVLASTSWMASLQLLRLVVYGSLAALALAVVVLLLIWWHEWRSGKAWRGGPASKDRPLICNNCYQTRANLKIHLRCVPSGSAFMHRVNNAELQRNTLHCP